MRAQQVLYHSLARRALSASPEPHDRFPPSEYYRYLKLLAAIKRPNLSVELGLCGGGGSFHLAIGWPAGTVVGVELAEGMNGYTSTSHERDNWTWMEQHCPNFVLWRGDSIASAAEIVKLYGQPDILFLDTVHEYQRTVDEFEAWKPYLSRRCVVCLDDLHRPGMQEAWDQMPGYKLRLDELHPGKDEGGFGIVWGWA